MKLKLLYTIAAVALCATASAADGTTGKEGRSLTLDECHKMALEQNRSIASAQWLKEQKGYDLKAMRANFMPNVALSSFGLFSTASGEVATASPAFPIIDFNVHQLFNAGLSVTQPLYMGGKVDTGYRMAKIGVEMAAKNLLLTEQEVIVKVDEAYSMLLKAKELLEVAKAYEALLAELEKNVASAVKHGVRTRNDLLKVKVKLNQARLSITRANNGYSIARMNLCRELGLPLESNISVEQMQVNEELRREVMESGGGDLSQRADYALLQQKRALAKERVRLVKSDYLPQLAAFANGGYMYGGKLALEPGLYNSKIVKDFNAMGGLTLSIPITHFGERRGKIKSAKAELQMATLECDEKEDLMRLELAQAHNTLVEQLASFDIALIAVEQANENVRLSKSAFDNGVETLSNLLEAQAMWQSARAEEVEARAALFVSLSRWRKAAGR